MVRAPPAGRRARVPLADDDAVDDAPGREVDGANSDGANSTADVILAGPEWPGRSVWRRWRGRWHASGPPTQVLLVSTLVSAVAALGFLTAAGRAQPRQHHRTVYATARPGPLSVDSAGCPVRVRCVVLAQVDPLLTAALHRTFPGVDVVSSVVVRDASSGRTYRRVVVARSAGTTLIVSAQCIPGTSAGPRRVLVHVGAPKTGTSFVQDLLWRNREELAAQGTRAGSRA